MNLQPISDKGRQTIINAGGNPADFAGYDPETSSFVSHAELRAAQDKSSALAPSNPYMAAVAEPVLRAGADMYRAGRRFPQAAAELVFGKQADAALRSAGATPITALNFLAEQALAHGARGAAQFRQPGNADTALSTVAGLTSAIVPYFVNPMLGLTASAAQGAGAGSEKAEAMGATPGQELANMTMRAGASAALDKLGMLGAAKTAWAMKPMAKLAARGALEGAATQGAFNVADKVTFNPNQNLSEGVGTSALVGAAAPVALRGAGVGIARLQGAVPPVMQTRSPRSILEEGNRLPNDKRQAFVDQTNERYPGLFGAEGLTLARLGGAEGNRMSDADIRAIIELGGKTGEPVPLASANQELVARLAREGLIDPTNIAEARRVLNEGPTAFADIQARNAGLLAASRVNEVTAAQTAAEAAAKGDVSGSVKILADTEAAALKEQRAAQLQSLQNQAQIDAGILARQQAEAAEQAKAVNATETARMKNVRAQAEAGFDAMQAGETAQQAAEKAKMQAATVPQTAQQAVKGAVQTAETLTPTPESAVTAIQAKAPTPAAAPENTTTAANAKTAKIAPQGKAKVGTDLPKVNQDAAENANQPSQAPTGTPKVPGKSGAAPTSVKFKAGTASDSSRVEPVQPVASTPNPPAAAVVEAGGAKAATPVAPEWESAVDMSRRLAREEAAAEYAKDVAAAEAKTSALSLANRPKLATDVASKLDQAMILYSQGRIKEAEALLASTSPKTEVASPVATVKAEPAIKTEPTKLTDAEKAELQAELTGGNKTPLKEVVESDLNSYVKRRAKEEKVGSGAKMTNRNFDRFKAEYEAGGIPPKVAAPAPLKIKSQQPVADPVSADRATLAALDLEVRPGKRGNWELYDKSIDEVKRDLGGMADEAEAVKEAARITREESSKGIGSKMRESRADEAGFVINPAELIEAGGRAVAAAARPILTRIRSATNQLGDYATRTGNETAAYGHRKLNETATVAAIDATKIINESQSFWNKLTSAERAELTDVLQYERAWRKEWPSDMAPKVRQAYLETRNLMRELGERAGKEGPRIQEGKEWRPLIVDEFWVPESLSAKIVKQLHDLSIDKKSGKTVRDTTLDEFRDWARQNGLTDAQIDTEIKRFDIENKTADADLEFDALHRPMTIPLPPGWAGNTQDAINRYATKYAFEMARHKYIDQDKLLGPMSRGQRESLDDLGRLTQRLDEAGQVGDTTDALFRAALNSFALQVNPGRQTVAQRLSSVANPLAVQTGATIRDTVNMFGTLVDDAGVKNSIKGVLDGVTKYRSLKERGLVRDTGNLSGDVQRVGEAFENGQVLETFRDALRAANRMSGVDALNKFMQAVSSAAGVARAKEAIAKNDEAFFKKVGIPEWRSKTPAEVEDFVARWVVEGSQGSMGAKDQPTHLLKGSGAGAQFFPIMKWAFAFSNQQIDRAWKPLMDASLTPLERVKPLATRLAGAAGATAVANTLLQTMLGRDDRNPTFKEWEAAGYPNKLKYLVQKMSDLQVLPAITAFANVVVGNQQMPRNLGVEVIPNLIQQAAALQEIKRDYSYEDYVKAVDALADKVSSNWRDLSKVAAGETKDEIEQARARYEGMNTAVRPAMAANPLNLATQFNKAKTVDELKEIAQRIVSTANLDTPDVSVKGPSEDAAFDKWLELSNPELSKQYRKQNTIAGAGLDQMYETKKVLAEAVNKALEQKRLLLASKEPNAVQRAKALKIDWKEGGKYEVK